MQLSYIISILSPLIVAQSIHNIHNGCYCCNQELMNLHGEKEQLTSIPILCRITLQNAPYKDYNLLMLTSFKIATVTTKDSQEPWWWPPAGF